MMRSREDRLFRECNLEEKIEYDDTRDSNEAMYIKAILISNKQYPSPTNAPIFIPEPIPAINKSKSSWI